MVNKDLLPVFIILVLSPIILMIIFGLCCNKVSNKCQRLKEKSQIKKIVIRLEKNYKYSLSNLEKAQCAICLENLNKQENILKLECSHIYHVNCLKDWYIKSKNKDCPMCRESIV